MANVNFKFLLFTGIDLVGLLREYDGKKYIVTAICYFSKYVEAKPISSKSAEEIALISVFFDMSIWIVFFMSEQPRYFIQTIQ